MNFVTRPLSVLCAFLTISLPMDARAQTEFMGPVAALSNARERLKEILAGAHGAFPRMAETLVETSPNGDPWWHVEIALWSVVALTIGYYISRVVNNRLRIRMAYLFVPDPQTRFDKISYLLIRTGMMLLALLMLVLIATGISLGAQPKERLPTWRLFLSQNLHILIAIYFVIALFVAEVRILSDLPIPFSPILVPIFLPIAGGFLYIILLLIIDGTAPVTQKGRLHFAGYSGRPCRADASRRRPAAIL
jgi:hypothetical protein